MLYAFFCTSMYFFFWYYHERYFYKFKILIVHCWYIGKQLTVVLQPYRICLLILGFLKINSLQLSTKMTMVPVNKDNFMSSFLIYMYFIKLARTSSTLLNGHGERGYRFLGTDLREKVFSFSL